MNFSLQNIDKVNAVITVELEKADYQPQVEKSLKKLRQQAKVPGFRPGMVPIALVQKMYGKSVKADEITKTVSENLNNYIKEQKINILGEPLRSADNKEYSDDKDSFEFKFDLALAPDFKVEATKDDKINYYTIKITDEMITAQVDSYRQRAGKYDKADSYQDKDMVKGLLTEQGVENGITVEGCVVMPAYFKIDDQKKLFEGAKVDDIITFNPYKAYEGAEPQLSNMMKIEKADVSKHQGDFTLKIDEITRFKLADLSQEVFDQVYGKDAVKTEEDFRSRIKEDMTKGYLKDSDFKFIKDVRDFYTNKIGKVEYPDALLKRMMKLNNPDKDDKFINDNYDKSIELLTWDLIRDQLAIALKVSVVEDDVLAAAKDATYSQFAQYGMTNISDDIIENYAKELLKKEDMAHSLFYNAEEIKIAAALKDIVTLNKKSITLEEFQKFFN